MKKIFYTLSLIALTFGVHAQLLLNENFNYTIGSLNGQGTWAALGTPATALNVVSGNLSYTGYEPASLGVGNSIQLTSGSSKDDLARTFNATSINSGQVYASFILTVNGISTSNPASYPVCFMPPSGSNNVCRLLVSSPTVGNVQFGIQRNSGTGASQSQAPTTFPYTASVTTFMIVIKYDFTNSTASLFVNPTLGGTEPAADATNASGTAFTDLQRIQFRQGDASGNYDISIDGLRVGTTWSNGVLPVTYKSFNIVQAPDANILRWTTASESNNSHFDIQRSTDGKNFETIGKVKGHGNSMKVNAYQYSDNTYLTAKTIYYRLKQVDYDGKFELSKTISISNTAAKAGISATLPNPFNDELSVTVSSNTATTATIELMDMIGKLHHTAKEQLVAGSNLININTTDMPDGIYFVRLTYNGETFTQKVIKK